MSARRGDEVILGTRGSELALAQARLAEAVLREKCGLRARIEIISTRGDRRIEQAAGRKGIFTAELEAALLAGIIDLAVHSAKDLPSDLSPGLAIAAVLARDAVEDVFIAKKKGPLATLPHAAVVATGSIRRQRQARWTRPDLNLTDLRGNVPTRLRKLAESTWDGIILARAGLERLNLSGPHFILDEHSFFAEVLPPEIFVPAGGQGIVALQTRVDDADRIAAADDHATHRCLRSEREFLRLLAGDCSTPVGAWACVKGGSLEMRAQYFREGAAPQMVTGRGEDPEQLAKEVWKKMQ